MPDNLKRLSGIGLLLLMTASPMAQAETLRYEIARVDGETPKVVARGSLEYTDADWHVEGVWRKRMEYFLPLDGDFGILYTEHFKPGLEGFGIAVDRRSDNSQGFSFEWFDECPDGTYVRRDSDGTVTVSYHRKEELGAIRRIEFITDVQLRYQESTINSAPGEDSHHIMIKAGSALAFPDTP